ncbi:MAG: hypothetical protein EA370_01405 [Wenzhouxiangella sp.]|nr:MAG: hypothetical protein EA370_01405 [Wenzhouxiangella sp.]
MSFRFLGSFMAGIMLAVAVHARADHVFEVNSLADSGRQAGAPSGVCTTGSNVSCPSGSCPQCTLRAAIETANALSFGMGATIAFADYIPTNASDPPFAFSMFLPVNGYDSIAREVHIDGTSHPEWDPGDGIPAVIIRGENAISTANGLNFGPGGAGSLVDAVAIYNFSQAGIRINADEVKVRQSHIGINAGGTTAQANEIGIHVLGNANVIGYLPIASAVAPWPNVISGNSDHGLVVAGHDNLVGGNYIGLNKAGTQAVGNGGSGVRVEGTGNRIGAQAFSDGFPSFNLTSPNVIAGNGSSHVHFVAGANQGEVACTRIGTNAAGNVRFSSGNPVALQLDSSSNQVGNSACSNIFAGQVTMGQTGSSLAVVNFNTFEHNFVGTNADGDDLGEDQTGVYLNTGQGHVVRENTIGNGLIGIGVGAQVTNAFIQANHVGLDAQGNAHPLLVSAIGSAGSGIQIGGSDAGMGNRIGNAPLGINLFPDSSGANVQSNWVGALSDGTAAPVGTGIRVAGSSHQIGNPGAGNAMANAEHVGVDLLAASDNALVRDNRIGSSNETAGGFGDDAIGIRVSGEGHVISAGNRIGSQHTGILVVAGAHELLDNFIGFDDDMAPRPNSSFGIRLTGSENARVIGNQVGFSNRGIRVTSGATGTVIGNNWLGVTPDGDEIGNALYGYYSTGAFNFFGTDPAATGRMPNVVGFNGSGGGVRIGGPNNQVINNFIGIRPTGQAIPNGGSGGLILLGNATGSQIGLSTRSNANFIGNNLDAGIEVRDGVSDVAIGVNSIGQGPGWQWAGNQGPGILIGSNASNIEMLSPPPTDDHLDTLRILHNQGHGIAFHPDAGTGNRIQRVFISNPQGKAIDLGPGGRDQDPGDADTGPNNLQNFPEFASPTFYDPDSETLTVTFRVDSAPGNSSYPIVVDIYMYDDGLRTPGLVRWFGSVLYPQADAGEFVTVNLPRPDHLPIVWSAIAATATDNLGNTSEMSDAISTTPTYTVGGQVSGLQVNGLAGLTLQNNGTDDLTIPNNGPFVFDTALEDGADYEVTVSQQPSGHICSVGNSSGQIDGENIDNVQVNCQVAGDEIFHDRFEPAPEPAFSFSTQLAPSFQHPRCMTCHAVAATDFQRVNDDPPGVLPASHPVVNASTNCVSCHTSALLPPTGTIDPGWQSAPAAMDFRGLDEAALCSMASQSVSGHSPLEHMTEDRLVLWAVGDGRVPFGNPDLPTAPPHDIEAWRALVTEWVDAGMPCD